MNIIYECSICGDTSTNKQNILDCEKQGRPNKLVEIGDIIYFEDNKTTSVFYDELADKSMFGIHEHKLRDAYLKCYSHGRVKQQYKVVEIIDYGHDYKYILGNLNGDGASCIIVDRDFEIEYPMIDGNELMKKILDEYN